MVSEDPVELVALVVSEDPAVQAVRELALAQVAVPELELVQAVPELELVQVEPELERGPVVAELERELVQVAAELELDPAAVERRLGPVAVALRTKSVTAAHPHDLVLLLEVEEDLAAAVAETTREPVAAEAVTAWAAEE